MAHRKLFIVITMNQSKSAAAENATATSALRFTVQVWGFGSRQGECV